jgi:hypothetical protein
MLDSMLKLQPNSVVTLREKADFLQTVVGNYAGARASTMLADELEKSQSLATIQKLTSFVLFAMVWTALRFSTSAQSVSLRSFLFVVVRQGRSHGLHEGRYCGCRD